MTQFEFTCVDAFAQQYAASPGIVLRLRIRQCDERAEKLTGGLRTLASRKRIEAIALRVRIQIEPARRGHAMRPLQWADLGVTVGGFHEETLVDVLVPCSYDIVVGSHAYLSALEDGNIPIRLCFNGTVFRGDTSLTLEMLPWDLECTAEVPVRVWRDAMAVCFGDQAWIRIDRLLFDTLLRRQREGNFFDIATMLRHMLGEQHAQAV